MGGSQTLGKVRNAVFIMIMHKLHCFKDFWKNFSYVNMYYFLSLGRYTERQFSYPFLFSGKTSTRTLIFYTEKKMSKGVKLSEKTTRKATVQGLSAKFNQLVKTSFLMPLDFRQKYLGARLGIDYVQTHTVY